MNRSNIDDVLAALAFAIATFSAGPPPVSAVCVVGIPLEKLIEHYPLVFEGTVTEIPGEIVLGTDNLPPGVSWSGLRVRFSVEKVWAGKPDKDIEIVYIDHAGQMHGRFRKAGRFIVWAHKRDDRWHTNDCAPTVERERASTEMLAFLERLKKQEPPVVR